MAKRSLIDILSELDEDDLKTLFGQAQHRRKSGKFDAMVFDDGAGAGDADEGDDGRRKGGFFGGD